MANSLKAMGVNKGDRVVLYLPMIPEAAYAMLACARIGAVHSVVFGGFSPDALADRIEDCGAKLVVTANEGLRGGRRVPLWSNTDKALERIGGNVKTLVVRCTDAEVPLRDGRDNRFEEIRRQYLMTAPQSQWSRGSPVYPLHFGFHRQTEGGAAYPQEATCSLHA